MTTLHSTPPFSILVILGLTLPHVSEADIAQIKHAAGPDSSVKVAENVREAIPLAHDVDFIFGLLPETLFKAAPRLQWVHAIASGVDMFLYPSMRESSVILTGEKGLVGGHLADTGFGLLLSLTRQIATAIRLGPDSWDHRGTMRKKEIELAGLTMGIIGFGGTGQAMALRAQAFGMRVLALDEQEVPGSHGVETIWGKDRLNALLSASDVVSICCPLTQQTRGLLNDATFAQIKPGALVLNVTRGEIIDGDSLVKALQTGVCGGAALDVAPVEPLPSDHPLWGFDNVVMTPHTAGASQLRAGRNLSRFCDNLRRIRTGEPLVGVIDKQMGY